MKEIRCPNCGTNFLLGNGGNAVSELKDGIHYLVPEVVRNENLTNDARAYVRIEALKAAGVDVTKLQTLMQSNSDLKDIFAKDDPIVSELSKDGFIDNPELFRRWICAQTFRLLKKDESWTKAVYATYDTKYVYKQTMTELKFLCHLIDKNRSSDIRFKFFTLDDFKEIFVDLVDYAHKWYFERDGFSVAEVKSRIYCTSSYKSLLAVLERMTFKFGNRTYHFPQRWLNCFKGAGAYYTLQNIIYTHGFVLPSCKDMYESLNVVESIFSNICSYEPKERRWDILMSLLTTSVKETKFELKY